MAHLHGREITISLNNNVGEIFYFQNMVDAPKFRTEASYEWGGVDESL